MRNQTGLRDRARFEAFSREWRDVALKEAEKCCTDERARQLLADAVLAEFQEKYADSAPPLRLDYQIRAQVCLVYSMTGENVRKLKNYLAEHALPPEAEEPAAPARPEPQKPPERRPEPPASAAKPVSAPEPPVVEPVSVAPSAPEPPAAEPVSVAPSAPEPPAAEPVKPEAPPVKPAATEKATAPTPKVRPDTLFDPVRTSYWTPNAERSKHVIAEVELPDDEEEERSTILSFINLVLFLIMVGAFGFCFYETGFLQYLLQ